MNKSRYHEKKTTRSSALSIDVTHLNKKEEKYGMIAISAFKRSRRRSVKAEIVAANLSRQLFF